VRVAKTSVLLFAACLLAGCGALFGPGFSMHDKEYFSESPHIVVRTNTNAYSLRWRYGGMGFFFQPSSKIVSGQLLFSLQATSSSGSLNGRYGEIPIADPKQIQTLQSGGAYWLEPDGRKIRLEVRKL